MIMIALIQLCLLTIVSSARKLAGPDRSFNLSHVTRIYEPYGLPLDNFGSAVAIQPGCALVGSPDDDDSEVQENSGSVFVYLENADTGEWHAIRKLEDGEPGSMFGSSLALHTDMFAVIGAYRGHSYGQFSGSAYYVDIVTDPYGDQEAAEQIMPSLRHGSAFYGHSVGITEGSDGKIRIVIGAYNLRGKGAAFVFTRRSDGTIQELAALVGSDTDTNDYFGFSVAAYRDIVVVGAPLDNKQGSAYVFEVQNGEYIQVNRISQTIVDDDANNPLYGDYFGGAVAAGNGFVAISSPHNDVKASDAGAVYIYTSSQSRRLEDGRQLGSIFTFAETIFGPDAHKNYRFGWCLSVDPVSNSLLVGSDLSHGDAPGVAYLYKPDSDLFFTVDQLFYPVQNENDDTEEYFMAMFGSSVSIFGDYVAIGAPFGTGEAEMSGDAYFYRAQSLKEYKNRRAGISSSTKSSEEEEPTSSVFDSVGLSLLFITSVCLGVFFLLWRKYTAEGENEGFGKFYAEELSEGWERMTRNSKQGRPGSMTFGDDDDSSHSSHPMVAQEDPKPRLSGLKGSNTKKSSGSQRYTSTPHEEL